LRHHITHPLKRHIRTQGNLVGRRGITHGLIQFIDNIRRDGIIGNPAILRHDACLGELIFRLDFILGRSD
jgi:hypothetical protein